jgi:hypothetical protein
LSNKGQDPTIPLSPLNVSSKKFLVLFLVMLFAQFIDLTIGTLSDLFVDFAVSPFGFGLFITISLVYGVGQDRKSVV